MPRSAAALRALLACTLAAPLSAQAAAPASPEWRRGSVCYEVFVRSFHDSDGDGVGDLEGLVRKLDHVNDGDPASQRDLGAGCIWLMPIARSTSYHGYDVTDYYRVDPEYGTNDDFKRLVAEAHRRGIRVIVDLVLNHMSAEHPYFRSALLDPASPYREWFHWSPTERRTRGWTAPTWHRAPGRDEYYYGLFWHGMPDLNLAHPAVKAEAERITRFWLEEMGADGFRLDAVGHFFESDDDPRNGPGVHPWLRDFAAHVRRVKPDAFTVGEVWDSIGAQRAYHPGQLDAYFAFEVSDALLDAVRTGAGGRLAAAVQRAERELGPGGWGSFQRNHDQTRTLTALGGDAARARLAASLLLTLPGIPFVYYGEEVGMTADKPDPRLRTPMHWTRAPAAGFTRGVPWEPLQPDSLTANVEAQDSDPASLLSHYRRLIHLRAAHPALGRGDFVPLEAGEGALAFLRRAEGRTVLVAADLGGRGLPGLSLRSAAGVLPEGRWTARPLLGGAARADLRAGADGALAGRVAGALKPFETLVLELSPAP
ncbi:MAG TPA: alpha-amylase family glycosyl hydrolase [Longimicrobiaceae bacterium]|nr:alpha-amylase family glycosyl hydrolase [Longimicrobiaceae bacterium]